MRTYLLSAIVLLLFVLTSALSQDSVEVRPTSLREGLSAIQYGISNNLTLSVFQGSVFAFKKMTSPSSAWRLAVSGFVSGTGNDQTSNSSDTSGNAQSDDGDSESLSASFAFINYLVAAGDVHAYFGYGPVVSVSKGHSENGHSNTYGSRTDIYHRENNSSSWGGGAKVLCGAEWFASKWLSINGEYQLDLTYTHSESTSRSTEVHTGYTYSYPSVVLTDAGSGHGWSWSGNRLVFGLAAYF